MTATESDGPPGTEEVLSMPMLVADRPGTVKGSLSSQPREPTSGARPALLPLTGLRFVAALAVVCYHATPLLLPGWNGPSIQLASYGYVGVSLFFVLSGFILAYTYLDSDLATLRGTVRQFWGARLARVYPMYLFGLVFAAPLFFRHTIGSATGRDALRDAYLAIPLAPTLLQGWVPRSACQWNCPGWSLSVEAFFYTLFPFVGLWLIQRRRHALTVATLAWVAAMALALTYYVLQPDGFVAKHATSGRWLDILKFNPLPHLPEFVLGVSTGVVFIQKIRQGQGGVSSLRHLNIFVGLTTALLVAFFAADVAPPYPLLHTGLLAPLWAGAIFTLGYSPSIVARVLATPTMVRLGEASYSLYLLHVPLLAYGWILHRAFVRHYGTGLQGPVLMGFYLLGSIALSLVAFRFLEEPARHAIRRRLRSRSAGHALRVASR